MRHAELIAALLCWGFAALLSRGPELSVSSQHTVTETSAAQLDWLSLGRPHTAATLLWAANTLHWIGPDPSARQVEANTLTVLALEPGWRAPARYGALMLGSLGDIDAHERVLERAATQRPGDDWFPRALAMSALLHHDDPDQAARWLRWAATQSPDPGFLERLADALSEGP